MVTFIPQALSTQWNHPPVSNEQDAGWAPEPNWTFWRSETSFTLPGSEPWIVQLVFMPVMTPWFCYRHRRMEKHHCVYQESVQLLYA